MPVFSNDGNKNKSCKTLCCRVCECFIMSNESLFYFNKIISITIYRFMRIEQLSLKKFSYISQRNLDDFVDF